MDSGAMDGHPSFRFFLSEWRCEMDFSTHALQRCRQRGIRAIQIDWLIAYGAFTWNRGAKVFFFDRSGFQLLLQSLLPAERQLAEKVRNAYVVTNDLLIVTVGRREHEFCVRKPGAQHQKACHRRSHNKLVA